MALVACGRGPIRIESIRVADGGAASEMPEAGLDEAALETAVRDGLKGAGFRLEGGRERTYLARATLASLRVAQGPGGAARAEVAVEIELAPSGAAGGQTVRETGTDTEPLGGSPPATAFRAALAGAARDAAGALALGFSEAGKSERHLVEDLAAGDARVRLRAVRVLGERGTRAAVPALVEKLHDEDASIQHAAIGALARIKDPRAVGPIIDVARRGDPMILTRLSRIIGDIGGPEAEGFLLTLSSGHPDPRVRRAAREALDEMSARAVEAKGTAARR